MIKKPCRDLFITSFRQLKRPGGRDKSVPTGNSCIFPNLLMKAFHLLDLRSRICSLRDRNPKKFWRCDKIHILCGYELALIFVLFRVKYANIGVEILFQYEVVYIGVSERNNDDERF